MEAEKVAAGTRPAPAGRALLAELGAYAAALVVALLLIGAALALIGADPLAAFGTLLGSSLGSFGALAQTLNKATPLLLGALAVTFALRGGYLNVGVDGQIYLGAIFATGLAFALGNSLPALLAVPLVLLAGCLGGAIGALPAAALRAYWGVNEIFVTVMLNFVYQYLADYLATGPWNDPLSGEAISRPLPAPTHLPMLDPGVGWHSGIAVALLVALGLAFVLNRTWLGFSIRAVGDNPVAARVGGIRLPVVALLALTVSGAVAGLAGAIEVSGYHQRLILGLSPGYGYMAILLAVLGKQRPLAVVVAAFAFAVLLTGSDSLQRSARLPQSAVLVFQAIILLSILFADALRLRGLRGLFGRRRNAG
ncbi:MAG: ABC transporter permease [Chloroflexota bacterium]